MLDRRQRVGDRADADPLDVGGVVARAAVVIVAPLGDAVVDQRREERRGHVGRVEPLDDAVAAHLDLDEMPHLRQERREEVVERCEARRIAGARAELAAGPRVDAVVQRQLQHLRDVEVAGQDERLLAERAHLDAAGRAAVPRILHALAHPHQLLDDQVGVEDGRLAEPGADDLAGALDEAVGVLAADLDGAAGLEQPHLLDHVQHQVGDVAHAVGAVGHDAARVDLREVGVGAALGRGDAHLRRRGLVVELDPEALEQFLGRVAGQAAVGQPAAVERLQMPVEVAGAERVPGVELGGHAQVDEPVRLQRLPEVARRVRGDARADLGDPLKLGFARRIGLDRGQLAGLLRVPLGEADHRVQRDAHGLELLALGVTRRDRSHSPASPGWRRCRPGSHEGPAGRSCRPARCGRARAAP